MGENWFISAYFKRIAFLPASEKEIGAIRFYLRIKTIN